ncbi:trichohyalin-like isoform X2 [Vanessa atalanta]|uniref:trichohyalin-like isoform X2 n=1 Tax=Vanessa atalanta TaxID=42275 RepID=UPI001FCD2012|nr:trichohyalin-like isoform X2 [Vanessa atalanta]
MLSTADLERLITIKRREIQQEKTVLGLSPPLNDNDVSNKDEVLKTDRNVRFSRTRAFSENNVPTNASEAFEDETSEDLKGLIPPDLERYIRRYIGLPVMLKAGEFSPNNPLIRAERTSGDALLGLGEYERRRNTLRKMRQRQYKEYLDQQAKIKQEAKEKAERESKEREEKDRLREEKERERLELERDIIPERRRASVSHTYISGANNTYTTKVDTGVQVDHRSAPLSVAVQTDDEKIFALPGALTAAERELSPRSARSAWPAPSSLQSLPAIKTAARDRLTSELRHSYRPSIFDAETIKMRNERAEQAAERRQFYQQELKNQIVEQQRIKEERKTREQLLEQAEMRRLEEQLRSLKTAQEREIERQYDINAAVKERALDYDRKRESLQKEIDLEHEALVKAAIHPKRTHTSKSESPKHSKLPFFYKPEKIERTPYSFNIPDNSLFSQNYDVESYLRRNLNPTKESLLSNKLDNSEIEKKLDIEKNVVIEKAMVHEHPKEMRKNVLENFDKDSLPIPVLRHSPKRRVSEDISSNLSEKMQIVDDKWRVPAVQKNILKSLPNEKGKNVSILTQLGSIRRQLQLEQLKLDKMMSKNN